MQFMKKNFFITSTGIITSLSNNFKKKKIEDDKIIFTDRRKFGLPNTLSKQL